jgi:hypothetical protein
LEVHALFEVMQKIDGMASSIPVLLDRLTALKALHLEAATFSDSLTMLTHDQAKMQHQLKTVSDVSVKVLLMVLGVDVCVVGGFSSE